MARSHFLVRRKADKGQAAIVDALKMAGAFVADLSMCGHGTPDLLARRTDGQLVLLEVKEAKGKLRPEQEAFIARWPDAVVVVRSIDEALAAVFVPREKGE